METHLKIESNWLAVKLAQEGWKGFTIEEITRCVTFLSSLSSPTVLTDEQIQAEANALYSYPEMCVDNEGEVARRIKNTIDKERSSHIRARRMSVSIEERKVAEKAIDHVYEMMYTDPDEFAQIYKTKYLDDNYPLNSLSK